MTVLDSSWSRTKYQYPITKLKRGAYRTSAVSCIISALKWSTKPVPLFVSMETYGHYSIYENIW